MQENNRDKYENSKNWPIRFYLIQFILILLLLTFPMAIAQSNAGDNASSGNLIYIAYIMVIVITAFAILIIIFTIRKHSKKMVDRGKKIGELMAKKKFEKQAESGEEGELTVKDDIDYSAIIDDMSEYYESLAGSSKDADRPVVQNINKYVTGYKYLKPPDVATLSLTKRFDEYEVSLELPQEKKGASKISEFIGFKDEERDSIKDEFQNVASFNNMMAGLSDGGGMGEIAYTQLTDLGKKLLSTFVPPTVQNHLREIKDPIIIESNDGEILWESIYNGENFLCLDVPIGRILKTKEEARVNEYTRGKVLNFLLIANPTGDLENTEREVNYIESILKKKVNITKLVKTDASKENILQALSDGEYDVIHYAGHADSESAGEDAALISSSGKLYSSEIKASLNGRPYVYLNACGSGREEIIETKDYSQISDTEGLGSAFILGGAIGFMGAFWPVPDKSAAEFSVQFYTGLIENKKVGEACRQARMELQKIYPHDITWAAFLQYGDPAQRIREKSEDMELEIVGKDELEGEKKKEKERKEELKISDPKKRKELYQGWILGGLQHLKNKDYEDAISSFDMAIGVDSERYNAWHLTGNALRGLQRFKEALECYEKAIERKPDASEIWHDKAVALGSMGKFEEAIECKSLAQKLEAGKERELLKRANDFMAQDAVEDAINIYNKILKTMPKFPEAWYQKGVAHMELEDYSKAVKCFANAIRLSKRFSLPYIKMGDILYHNNQFEKALSNYNDALAINPGKENLLMKKGSTLFELKKFNKALECYNTVLDMDKNNAEAWLKKAPIHDIFNEKEQALKCYDNVMKLNPDNIEAWHQKLRLLRELGGEEKEIIKCVQKLIDSDIDDETILFEVEEQLEELDGLEEEKIQWYDKYLQVSPQTARLWLKKARILDEQGKKEDALKIYLKCSELEETNEPALLSTARIYKDLHQEQDALKMYEQAKKINPDNIETLKSLAQIMEDQNRIEEAFRYFVKIGELDSNDVENLQKLNNAAITLRKYSLALRFLNILIKKDPKNINYMKDKFIVLNELEKYQGIIEIGIDVLKNNPDDSSLWEIYANALTKMGREEESLKCWERVIELETKNEAEPDHEGLWEGE
ncbi:MAG: tetratricopeptide repeat protein [Methanomassiliicoccales archaeon]|nr:MAG: tetratricopeptide repeat protein [Methanomassiliicoccales archaeon]